MNKKIRFALLLLPLPFLSPAETLDDVVNHIMSLNPAIPASGITSAAETASLMAENDIPLPSIDFGHLWSAEKGGADKTEIGVIQEIPFPSVVRARREIASEAKRLAELRADARIRAIRRETATAVAALYYAERIKALTDSFADDARTLTETLQKGYDLGRVSIIALNDARFSEAEILSEQQAALRKVDECRAAIDLLVGGYGLSQSIVLPDSIELPAIPDSELCASELLLLNPDVAEASTRAIEAGLMASAAKAERYGSLAIGYKYSREENTSYNGLTVSYTLPSTGASKKAQAARIQAESAQSESQLAEAAAENEIKLKLQRAESLLQEIKLLEQTLESSNQTFLLQKAYEGREITIDQYILGRRQVLQTKIRRENALAEYCSTILGISY